MARLFALVFTAMSLIVLGDTAGKTLTSLGVAPVIVAWTRFAIAAVLLLPFSGLTRDELRVFLNWRLWLRAALICGGIVSILSALRTEPIADVFGVFFIGPVVSYVLSALLLKETVTRGRSMLLGLGFVGVLLVVKPGFGVAPGLMLALLAGVFYGAYLTATRWLAPVVRPRLLLLSQLLIGAVLLAPLGLSGDMPPLDVSKTSLVIVALIVASAVCSALGNFILVTVSRTTPGSLVSPLIYTQLVAATLAGLVFFGDLPDAIAMAGLALILVSGLASLYLAQDSRERR